MDNLKIINAVPTYKDAPVPSDVLAKSLTTVLDKLLCENVKRKIILLDIEDYELIKQVQEALKGIPELCLEVIEIQPEFRMLYNNESAVLNLLNGVNPLPKSMDKNHLLINIEDYMNLEQKLVYVKGKIQNPGRKTINKMTTPREILAQHKMINEVKAMFFGYPMGKFVGINELDHPIEITTDLIHIYDEEDCMLNELFKLSKEFAEVSCGRCVYGYEGITQIRLTLHEIIQKKGKPDDLVKLYQLTEQMEHQTICDVGKVIARMTRDALERFGEEIQQHMSKKVCQAMVCEKFMTYHILASKCIGCTECIDSCGEEAILGKSKFVHVIEQSECTQCGDCINACDEGAIVRAGAVKPKCPPKPIPCIKR